MKTGSFVNLMAIKDIPRIPQEGEGCTILHWSDRDAGTIVTVEPGAKRIWVQADVSTRTDKNGMSDAQSYSYEPNPNAPKVPFTLRKNGKYYQEGATIKGSMPLLIGTRMTYYDYSF